MSGTVLTLTLYWQCLQTVSSTYQGLCWHCHCIDSAFWLLNPHIRDCVDTYTVLTMPSDYLIHITGIVLTLTLYWQCATASSTYQDLRWHWHCIDSAFRRLHPHIRSSVDTYTVLLTVCDCFIHISGTVLTLVDTVLRVPSECLIHILGTMLTLFDTVLHSFDIALTMFWQW